MVQNDVEVAEVAVHAVVWEEKLAAVEQGVDPLAEPAEPGPVPADEAAAVNVKHAVRRFFGAAVPEDVCESSMRWVMREGVLYK